MHLNTNTQINNPTGGDKHPVKVTSNLSLDNNYDINPSAAI